MVFGLIKKIVGTRNDREIKRIQAVVEEINDWENKIKPLTDGELKAKTQEFNSRILEGASLDDILPEAFAVVREASWRTLEMRHFDAQMTVSYTHLTLPTKA